MSYPSSIPVNYARTLQKELDKVTDEQKLAHFDRLVNRAAQLEIEAEADEVGALRQQVRELERQVRELEKANKALKKEREVRRSRRNRGTIRHMSGVSVVAPTTREEQEDICWKQRNEGNVA